MPPGKDVGTLLEAAFEAQMEGHFHDLAGAYQWLARQPASAMPPHAESALRAKQGLTTGTPETPEGK
jgi:hypothetical protein